MKSSSAWHRNAQAARARARRASRIGDVTESHFWRILDHHGSEMTKNARQQWCVKCSSWKWANGTKCHCRAKESVKTLTDSSDLSDASRQDLQATLKKLEGAKQNAVAAPKAVSALEERIQQVKDAKLQTAIGRAEGTVKNRREQLWQSQEALAKARDHLWELQRRLEELMQQRKEEEDQGYDAMDLQDGLGSWWIADSTGLDDDEEHAREWSQQSWRSWCGYQPCQDWHRSQCAVEDLSVKFAEMQKYIGNVTTQNFSDRGHVGDPSANTPAEAECVCRRSWLRCPCDFASSAAAGTAVAEQEGQSRWRQPQKVADGAQRRRGWCGRRRFVHRSVGPALGCAAGCSARDALATVQQLRLHMGMRHPHDVLQISMHEMFLGLPLAADEEHVTCLTIFYRWLGES